jgi:hypothetical protein
MKRILLALALLSACISASQAESIQAQEFPSTNEERGCVLALQITASETTREECRGLIESAKKHDDSVACVLAIAFGRVAKLNEAPSKRPPGFILSMMKACSMMTRGISAKRAEAISEEMCAKSHDPEFVTECRGAGYR